MLFQPHGGALLATVACAVMLGSQPAAAQTSTLPAGWTSRDIGNPSVAGSAGTAATTTVRGAGTDFGGSSDQGQFVYQTTSGDVDLRVRVADLENVDPAAKAGLMIRASLNANAKNAFMFVSAGQGLALQSRAQVGRNTVTVRGASGTAPAWIRLVRRGDVFNAYSSLSGADWTPVGTVTLKMSATTYVGLAVTSHDAGRTATAHFTGLASGPSAPPSVASPWSAGDIGTPALFGAASGSGGLLTVTGAGTDISGSSDQLQFVYQAVTGDTQIVALVARLAAADAWSKAGVMIRGSLAGDSAHAAILATGSNGWSFARRLAAGASTYATGSAGATPGWVRLVREGDLFGAYQSADGSQWTLVGTDTIAMPGTVYVGLPVTSHNPQATATATFSNVAISTPTSSNVVPTVAISAPSNAAFTAPAQIAISATAGDVDGTVMRVEFFAGTQAVGMATASPFTATWNNVPAGTYVLTAVATDNGGGTATSMPLPVTVAAAAISAPITTLVFVAPTDYATNVDSCTVRTRQSLTR